MKIIFFSYLKFTFAALLFFSLISGLNYSFDKENTFKIEMNAVQADGGCGPSCKYEEWNCMCGEGSSRSMTKFCKRAEAGSCTGGSTCTSNIRCYTGPKQ